MKILFLTDKLDTGGAETHVETLARELAARGHDVAVFTSGGQIADRLSAAGIRILPYPDAGRDPLSLFALLCRLRRTVRDEKPDILHAHTRRMGVLLFCLRTKAGRFVTLHAARFGFLTRRMCRSGTVIAVSEDLRRGLIDTASVPAEVIHVIPNGIDPCRFFPPVQPPPPHSVLFASRLDPDCSRAAELLLAAVPELLRRCPDLTLTLAGGGGMFRALAEQARQLNRTAGRTVVSLPGAVSDMAPLYRAHRITVGVSRVALEAAACGCAVLLAGNEGYGGILSAGDVAPALSNFCCRGGERTESAVLLADLLRLLSAPSAVPSLTLSRRIRRDFSAARMADDTERLYRQAVPPRGQEKPVRLLVGGYAGCGNLGDDAILAGLTACLRETRPDVHLTALTGSPARDTRRFGIPCINRRALPSVFLAMLRADVFLLGGGSLLQDGTSRRSLAYYLFLLRLARLAHCRTGILAAGLGPFRSPASVFAVLRELEHCRILTLRDAASLRFLVLKGMERSRLSLVPDPALLLPPPPPMRRAAILSRLHIPPSSGVFCVVVRSAGTDADTVRILAAAVRRAAETFGLTPIFPVLDRAHDASLTRSVIRLADCGGRIWFPDEAADLPALLSGAALLVSMRLHALLFADAVGTSAIAISPDRQEGKLAEFARTAGFAHIPAPELDVVPLAAEMEQCLAAAPGGTANSRHFRN